MILQHFLFGPSDHLPFERRVVHFAETGKPAPGEPEELKPTSDVTINVNSEEYKNWQKKLAKEGILIGSLADHRIEDTHETQPSKLLAAASTSGTEGGVPRSPRLMIRGDQLPSVFQRGESA